MSRKLLEKARRRMQEETGCRSNPWGGRLSVALVYPNTYHQAMSNLGFLSVYHLVNSREGALCERFFLPDPEDIAEHRKTGTPLFSLESGRPLADFDLIAFSISFENDYLHLPVLFDLARIPLLAADRGARFPLVLCGGVCAFLNPEPLAGIMDLFAVGEGEALLPGLLDTLGEADQERSPLFQRLAALPGIYVPSLYEVAYRQDGTVCSCSPGEGAPARVRRQWLADLDAAPTRSFVQAGETEFGDMALVEISRGCSRGCRFCAAGFIYLPPRERSLEHLSEQVEEGLCHRNKVGLVGAAVSDYSRIEELNQAILQRGGRVSVASLRIDSLTAEEVAALKESGHKTVSLAPEAGSQRMRDLINKGLDEAQILHAVRFLAEGGIPNLKLYFLIGLPGEKEEDIEEMLGLVTRIREVWVAEGKRLGRLGQITLSVNPFIPKPFTPLQWAPMEQEKSLRKKVRRIRSFSARQANVEATFESLRGAALQAFLSRGDRRVGSVLPALAAGENLRAACREAGLDPAFYLYRTRGENETFPWDVIDNGVRRDYLWQEYERALEGRATPRCTPGCRRCGVCG
ncbi:MAG: radical SAM protein [Desulfuromonas sp.]|uniref:radical SAM protein n=1 Tax=Desulfuromonas sp. TaxID=892 RepID=UPI000CB21C04|nr:radical SAM protein [Desulfuromonas sp.]PLX81662.1 MAG: radical SAM protein [Desulfuromonas sp.]